MEATLLWNPFLKRQNRAAKLQVHKTPFHNFY
jgi:hypothetical protein